MPWKWKIFRATNYTIFVLTLGALALFSYFFFDELGKEPEDIGYFVIFVLCMLIISANFCNNILLTDSYYPSLLPEENFQNFSAIMFFLTCLIIAFVTVAMIAHISGLVADNAMEATQLFSQYIGELLLLVYFVICYYVFWMQVALRKMITRNASEELDKFLR